MPSHIVLNIGATFLAIINTALILYYIYVSCVVNIYSTPLFITLIGYIFAGVSLVFLYFTWFLIYKIWKIPYSKD